MDQRERSNLPEVERCSECGHALSMHNSLGYCRSKSKADGECTCDLTRTVHPLPKGRCLAHMEYEPCQTCGAYIAAGL